MGVEPEVIRTFFKPYDGFPGPSSSRGEVREYRVVRTSAGVYFQKVVGDPGAATQEREMLHRLADVSGVPKLALVESPEGKEQVVTTHFIDGRLLTDHVSADRPSMTTFCFASYRIVAALHRAGVAHRDVRPWNFMWDGTKLTLLDFEHAVGLKESVGLWRAYRRRRESCRAVEVTIADWKDWFSVVTWLTLTSESGVERAIGKVLLRIGVSRRCPPPGHGVLPVCGGGV